MPTTADACFYDVIANPVLFHFSSNSSSYSLFFWFVVLFTEAIINDDASENVHQFVFSISELSVFIPFLFFFDK